MQPNIKTVEWLAASHLSLFWSIHITKNDRLILLQSFRPALNLLLVLAQSSGPLNTISLSLGG
jgi:hypothetical protein